MFHAAEYEFTLEFRLNLRLAMVSCVANLLITGRAAGLLLASSVSTVQDSSVDKRGRTNATDKNLAGAMTAALSGKTSA